MRGRTLYKCIHPLQTTYATYCFRQYIYINMNVFTKSSSIDIYRCSNEHVSAWFVWCSDAWTRLLSIYIYMYVHATSFNVVSQDRDFMYTWISCRANIYIYIYISLFVLHMRIQRHYYVLWTYVSFALCLDRIQKKRLRKARWHAVTMTRTQRWKHTHTREQRHFVIIIKKKTLRRSYHRFNIPPTTCDHS